MGLDQYAFAGHAQETSEIFAQWRKHPNLQGWMEQRWISKGRPCLNDELEPEVTEDGELQSYTEDREFNLVNLELTEQDIDDLEKAINEGTLPKTSGFFFGDDGDEYYKAKDLKFCRDAKANLKLGRRVFYSSWW